jgi:hypothetical protein
LGISGGLNIYNVTYADENKVYYANAKEKSEQFLTL